ncbi:ankyrin repeat protein [Sulfitobacter undariae]|uniref:Ankyrin repeat protein n=2 Tax=Sulfitobacter undariae TaxID=1563671 RepID=A0A7W6E6B1_9RHOB|nr:ankyrin repeat protein [Sulfitobacter undariae]
MKPIRKMLAVLFAALGLTPQPAVAHGTPLEAFFELVAVGTLTGVKDALEHEPDLAVRADKYGFTAIHVLDYLGFAEKLALLQRFGADVNAQNDEGHALLHVIIDPSLIDVAVSAGADVNLTDHQGRTPIMIHLLEPDGTDFVPALLAAGANVNVRDAKGVSVLSYAAEFDDPQMMAMLIDAGAKP